jgi:dolichol-phosphate mannosyltransferase
MIYILLPAYNEESDIGPLFERIIQLQTSTRLPVKVLVVDDGSQDHTCAVVQSYSAKIPLEILDHGGNRGLGQAMLTGLKRAAEVVDPDDVVIAMDADNTHDPGLIPAMALKIKSGDDLVIASRYESGGEEIGLHPIRKLLSRGASLLLRLFFPIQGAKDYTCGYRAYRGSLVRKGFAHYGQDLIAETGFTCMAELLIKLSRLGARISEVPLVLRYDFKSGKSKMKFMRTIFRYGLLIYTLKHIPA